MMLNALLITAIFIAAAFVAKHSASWVDAVRLGGVRMEPTLWFAAAVLSLPMFIATFRKLQALGLLVADLKVPQRSQSARAKASRSVIANAVPIAGTIVLGVYVLLLSSALLPPFKRFDSSPRGHRPDYLAPVALLHQGLFKGSSSSDGNVNTAGAHAAGRAPQPAIAAARSSFGLGHSCPRLRCRT